jgi:SEC-C motif-containing protein
MSETNCYCGSNKPFINCCEPFLLDTQKAPTAEALMRSRYSAYAVQNVDYLISTTHPSTRKYHNKKDTLAFAIENHWMKLEIINSSETIVEFKAYYLDNNLKAQIHHEKSTFKKEDDSWYYVDGEFY